MLENDNLITKKVILLGDTSVGKTSLINAIAGKKFNPNMPSSNSTNYIQKIYGIDSIKYKVNLWDTAGQEKYRQITKLFYKGSDIVIFVYDITVRDTFYSLEDWIKEVKDIIDNKYICGIVGNKRDLYFEEEIKEEEAKQFANKNNMKFKLVSAKNDPKRFDDFLRELLKSESKISKERRNTTTLNKDKKQLNGCNC